MKVTKVKLDKTGTQKLALGKKLTLKATVNYNHLPASGKEKTDRAVVAQVGYNF